MDAGEDNGDANAGANGAQDSPAGIEIDEVHDAAEQLEASISRFAQEDERTDESRIAVLKQVGSQLRSIDAKTEAHGAEIDKLANRIRSYRS